jgi:flagellar protein FlaG
MEISRVSQGGQTNTNYANKADTTANSEVKIGQEKDTSLQNVKNSKENLTPEDIKKSVEKLNKFLEGEQVHAVYEIHEKLKDVMIKIVNNDTNEVVLEIPSKKILDMVANMLEAVGILVDSKA